MRFRRRQVKEREPVFHIEERGLIILDTPPPTPRSSADLIAEFFGSAPPEEDA